MRLTAPRTPAPGGGVEPALRLDFLSSDEFRGQGGSLFPAATPPTVNNGLVLNGVDQSATIPLAQYTQAFQGGVSDEVSIYQEFFPDFNYTEAVIRSLWDGAAPNRYICYKNSAGPDYFMYFFAGATTQIAAISAVVYGALWQTGGRNRVLVTAKSGANAFYLNGTQIGTSVTAWSRALPSIMSIGATPATFFFDGTITDFRIYNRKLTSAEALEMTTVT